MSAFLTVLWWLLVAHALTDALLQGGPFDYVAKYKDPAGQGLGRGHWPYWMFLHGVLNGLGVYYVTGVLECMIGEVIAHSLIDLGKCRGYYGVHTDQVLHVTSKVVWSVMSVWPIFVM